MRKSESKLNAEAQAERRARFSPLLPLFLGACAGLMALLYEPSWKVFVGISAAFFVVIYGWRLVFGDRHLLDFSGMLIVAPIPPASDRSCLCPACHKPQLSRAEGCVACGTKLEDMSRWEWIERPKTARPSER